MKKILSLFLITAICLATLASCGNTATTPTTGSTVGTNSSGTTSSTTTTVPFAELFGSTVPAVKAPQTSTLPEYNSYVCAQGNGAGAPQMEKNWWPSMKDVEVPFTTKKVVFENTEYSLSYNKTTYPRGSMYGKHRYESNKEKLTFYVNDKTNECVGFFFGASGMLKYDTLPDIENFEDNFLNMSDKYVSQFIDTKDYERTYKHKEYATLPNTKVYKVTYTKYYKGIETNDSVNLEITSKGEIKSLNINNVGAFDDVTKDIDMEKVNESVEETIYASCTKEVANYKIEEQFLGHTPDGDLAIISTVSITVYNNKAENITSKTATVIATAV